MQQLPLYAQFPLQQEIASHPLISGREKPGCWNVFNIPSFIHLYYISNRNIEKIEYGDSVTNEVDVTVSGTFANKTYINVKLYVPNKSLEKYKKADVWKDFWNIEGHYFSSGISTPTIDKTNKPDVIYDLQGRKLTMPQKGINIINGKKVVMK